MKLLELLLKDNPPERWLLAVAAAAVTLGLLRLAKSVFLKRLVRLTERTATAWDDAVIHMLGQTQGLTLLVAAAYAGSTVLELPDRLRRGLDVVTVIALLIQAGVWGNAAISFFIERQRSPDVGQDPARTTTMGALSFVARLVLWSVVILLVLDNAGINVTALVAGLGVGGIAVALAAQTILGDLFASLAIALDRPFALGDFLAVDGFLGSVEHVGIKTTRLRSLSGEQLVFGNADLLKSRIRNYKRMSERRVVFTVGVTYQTSRDKLRRIPAIIRQTIEAQEKARFDRCHFSAYGDSSLDFETVYYVEDPDYTVYMDVRQAVNFGIHEGFEQKGIEFAYPTRTILIRRGAR